MSLPKVLALTGSEDLLRRRALQGLRSVQSKKGWYLLDVDGEQPGSLNSAFSQAAMFGGNTLAVVFNPDKSLPALEQHVKMGADTITLALYYEDNPKGNTKFGKFVNALGKDHKQFTPPEKEWERQKFATSFCIAEAKDHGLRMGPVLAESLVDQVGTDLGTLSFEILKMATLAKADNLDSITVPVAKACLSTVTERGIHAVLAGLAARDAKKLSKALDRVKRSYKDPFIPTCRAIETQVYSWFPIVRDREAGKTPKESAEAAGLNVWFYTNKLFPQAAKWATPDLLRLVAAMAETERSLLRGALSPWTILVARLLRFCEQGVASPGFV